MLGTMMIMGVDLARRIPQVLPFASILRKLDNNPDGKFVVGSHDGGVSYHKTIDLSGKLFKSFENKIPRRDVKSWTILELNNGTQHS